METITECLLPAMFLLLEADVGMKVCIKCWPSLF